MRHGAKVKRCSSDGCNNQVQKGGVCIKHGANRNPYEESTAFESAFDKTTATLPNLRASTGSKTNSGIPEVVVCGNCNIAVENYEEI